MYHLYVLEGECESFDEIEHDVEVLNIELQNREEEIHQILQEMAHTVVEYENQIEFSETGITENKGKSIADVGSRHVQAR